MNNYFKNYGIWLGGSLLASYALSYLVYFPFFFWLFLITGTILGTVQTHKAEGNRIKFGQAAAAVILTISAYKILMLLLSIVLYGMIDFGWYLPLFISELLISVLIGISILLGAGVWYMFEKAGKPGWACLVPIYNIVVMLEIAKKPTWWIAMFFVPIANIVFLIMMYNGIAKNFGKDSGFTVGLVFLNQIFFAILGYDSSEYQLEIVRKNTNNDLLDN